MSLSSMTGFGRGEAVAQGLKATVELSSINRKQFECHFSLPRNLGALEAKLYALIQSGVRRGQVKGMVQISTAPGAALAGGMHIDFARAKGQVAALRRAGAKLGLPDDLTVSLLLTLPDVVKIDAQPDDALLLWPTIRRATEQAMAALIEMRLREGRALTRDLVRRFKSLRALSVRAAKRAARAPADHRDVLARRLTKLSAGLPVDPAILARELIVYADRADISEELTRLASHLDQADLLMAGTASVGRTLDFLCQELLREINTIGSKSSDAALSTLVVAFKAQLESVREQVQNIE